METRDLFGTTAPPSAPLYVPGLLLLIFSLLAFRFAPGATPQIAVGLILLAVFVLVYSGTTHRSAVRRACKSIQAVTQVYSSTVEALALAVDAKDQPDPGHVFRVQTMALGLARRCGMRDENELKGLSLAALLHDIGKLATPDYLYNKTKPLTELEMATIKSHSEAGAKILSAVPSVFPVAPIVRHHHERWDGKGYPDALRGPQIPLGARILSVVDSYDSLRSDRPYRPGFSPEAALNHIRAESGRSFDPFVVGQLLANARKLDELAAAAQQRLKPKNEGEGQTGVQVPGPRTGIANRDLQQVLLEISTIHKEARALRDLTQSVGRLSSVSQTLAVLAEKIKSLVPCDACCAYLADDSRRELIVAHALGKWAEQFDGLRIRYGEGPSGEAVATSKCGFNAPPRPDFSRKPAVAPLFKSCLSVPVAADQRTVAVITLYSDRRGAFAQKHLKLVNSVLWHAAPAVRNALVYDETREDACTDPLTGLPNLRYLKAFLEPKLKQTDRPSQPTSVIMMDLDDFKKVNDELGHPCGDRVLIEVSRRLRSSMRKSDTCVRYGGDEFVGVLPGVGKSARRRIIRAIQRAIDARPVRLEEGQVIQVGVSIGVATYPNDGLGLEELLLVADQDMYRNKILRDRQDKRTAKIIPFGEERKRGRG